MSSRKRTKRRIRGGFSEQKLNFEALKNRIPGVCAENDHEDILVDNLRAMLRQEKSGHYHCAEYLSMTPWQKDVYRLAKKKSIHDHQFTASRKLPSDSGDVNYIDEYCREQIVEWSFRVVDYFGIDREVVVFSISFLDRFLTTCRCDRTSFKLAATTTLQLGVKLLYPCRLADLGILSDLSRGEFEMNDVAEMENNILRALSWHLHPPTPVAFASILLDYVLNEPLTTRLSMADLDSLYDFSSFFGDLAVCDYFFVSLQPSSIAIASILNALEGMFGSENKIAQAVLIAADEIGLFHIHDLSAARNRLWKLYERSEECALNSNKVSNDKQNVWNGSTIVKRISTLSSPVSVSSPRTTSGGPEIECRRRSRFIRNTSW